MKKINYNFILLIVILFLCLCFFNSILIYFYFSAFLAFLIHPIVKYISKKFNLNRKISTFIIIALMIISLLLFLASFVPVLFEQLKTLIINMSKYISKNQNLYNNISNKLNKYGILIKDIENLINNTINQIYNLLMTFTSKIFLMSSKLIYIVIVLILTSYFLIDYKKIMIITLDYFNDDHHRIIVKNTIQKSSNLIWEYIKYKTIISFIMSIVTFLILKILNSDYVILLSTLTFFLDYIPYFGSVFAVIMIFIVVLLSTNLSKAILAISIIFIIQQIEGNIITPQIQGKSLGIHPIIVIFALLACDKLWGSIGMFIAIPVAIIIKVFLYEFFAKKQGYNNDSI